MNFTLMKLKIINLKITFKNKNVNNCFDYFIVKKVENYIKQSILKSKNTIIFEKLFILYAGKIIIINRFLFLK